MKKREKIKKLVQGLSSFDDEVVKSIDTLNQEIADFTIKIKAGITAETLGQVKDSFKKLEKGIVPLNSAVQNLGEKLSQREEELVSQLRQSIDEISRSVEVAGQAHLKISGNLLDSRAKSISDKLNAEIARLHKEFSESGEYLTSGLSRLLDDIRGIDGAFKSEISKLRKIIASFDIPDEKAWQKKLDDLEKKIDKVRTDLLSAVSSRGGGNANRNILVGNNPSTLGRYTDLNLKAGTNITLSYVNNDNLKTTDLTIESSGGTGSSRSISTLAVSSVLGEAAGTDYVYIASQGVKLDLPTAVGNTNLYTIKNAAASSVMVAADGAETIDGDSEIILQTQYTAVDLISDDSAWHIT